MSAIAMVERLIAFDTTSALSNLALIDDVRAYLKGYGIEGNPEPEILWNFEKFLVSRSGQIVARFAPDTQPDAPEFVAAIKAELDKA